jgi:hypothetical protein
MRVSDDQEDFGYVVATIHLRQHMQDGRFDFDTVKRLLDANADPLWHGSQFDADSAVSIAIEEERLELLRLMCASCPDIDPPSYDDDRGGDRASLMELALSLRATESAICLFELGYSYKHLVKLFHVRTLSATADPLYESYQNLMPVLYGRFLARESNCQRVVIVLLARRVRTSVGVSKDIAQLLGRVVWQSRRKEEWDSEEMRRDWNGHVMKIKELERLEDE